MFRFDLNTSALSAAMDRLKGELPAASRDAVKATAEESLRRIQNHAYWKRRTGDTADTFRVVMLGSYASRVTTDSLVAKYLNEGTKAHGPTRAKALRFVINGSVRFAKRVKGIKAIAFEAKEKALGQPDLEEYGDSALRRAVERSGLG